MIFDPANAHEGDHWFGYECVLCPVANQGIGLDVRAPRPTVEQRADLGPTEAWRVACPFCSRLMVFKGYWKADEEGYGSRADGTRAKAINLVRAATAFEREACIKKLRHVREEAKKQPNLTADQVAESCIYAIKFRDHEVPE